MSDFLATAEQLTPDMVERFRRAVEIGKWPDGRIVSAEQRDILLQALIVYEEKNIDPSQRAVSVTEQCSSSSREAPEKINIDSLHSNPQRSEPNN